MMTNTTDRGEVPAGLGGEGRTVEVQQTAESDATQTFDLRASFGELTLEVRGTDRKEHLSPERAERLAAVTWTMAAQVGGPKRHDAEALATTLGEWAAWASDTVEWSYGDGADHVDGGGTDG